MKNLSVQKLRKIILEELQSMLNDDVLFSLDQLPTSGTGKVKYDNDDMLYPYDDEEDESWMAEFIGTSQDLDMDAVTGTGTSTPTEEKKEEEDIH